MFISRFTDLSQGFTSSSDWSLLALSAVTATLAAWISLGVAQKLRDSSIKNRWLWYAWWLSGSVSLGLAVWGFHFIAILALRLPIPFSFDPTITTLSILPPVLVGAVILRIAHVDQNKKTLQFLQVAMLGGGMVLMHYIGMMAMQLRATILYDPAWFTLSVVTALVLSWVILQVKWRMDDQDNLPGLVMLAPSLVMGLSLLGIHLVAMLGTYFFPDDLAKPADFQSIMGPETLAWLIAGLVLLMAVVLAGAVQLSHRLELANLVEKSADFNRSLLDTANEGIITANSSGIVCSFNAAAERLFGLKAVNVVGQSFTLLLSDFVRRQSDFYMSGDQLNLPRIVNRTLELKVERANGTTFEAELTITPLQRGGHLELVGVVRDISRRKNAERQLQAQKEHLEFLLAASPIIVFTRKASGSMPFTFVSPNVQEIFGYRADDIKANTAFWTERIHPEDHDRVLEARGQLNDSGSRVMEYRIQHPNGDYRWISERQVMTRDKYGKPDIIIGNWADISERKETEEKIEANEQRMRISLEHAQLATWDWIISSGEVIWSDDMGKKLGMDESAPSTYETFMSCVHPEDHDRVKAAFRQCLVKGERFDEEYRVVWPNRSVHWLHSIGGLVNDGDGNPVRVVGILYDKTDQKKLHLAPEAIQESA